MHWVGAAHVRDGFFDGAFLGVCEIEGEAVVEFFQEGCFGGQPAAGVGAVLGAAPDDVELGDEEGLESEAAAGGFAGCGCGWEMGFGEVCEAVRGGDGVWEGWGRGFGAGAAELEGEEDDFPQAALVEAGDVFVDGDDAVEVDGWGVGWFRGVLVDDLGFGVIHEEPAGMFFYFAVGDDVLAGGDYLCHEGHVEPAAGDFSGAEDAAGALEDDCLEEACFAEAFGFGVDDGA